MKPFPLPTLHPRRTTLVRCAEGEPMPPRVKSHLARCSRCRGIVQRAREVIGSAPDLAAPQLDAAGLWARIDARAQAGERVLLPVSDLAPPQSRWLVPKIATAGLIGLAALGWMLARDTQTLVAGVQHGEVVVDSLALQPGRAIPIRYRASGALAGVDSLLLRAEFLAERRRLATRTATVALRRSGDEWYSGALEMPSDALMARLTVTSTDGRVVDDNDGAPWELVARDARGIPLYEALFTRYAARARDDWELGHRIVQEMVRYHPDNPAGWRFHAHNVRELAGPRAEDSVRAVFTPELERLHRLHAEAPMTSNLQWEMAMLSSALRDTAKARFWRTRLQREFPTSTAAAQFRVFEITARHPDPRTRLREFETLYAEVGPGSPQLEFDAFDAAVTTGDSALVHRWGDRLLQSQPAFGITVDEAFIAVPSLRAEGLRRLRGRLAEHAPVTDRDWAAAFQRGPATTQAARQTQALLQRVATALVADGRLAAAYDTLQRAGALGRTPRLPRQLAHAALAAGDTATAARAWAWVAADPRTDPAIIDSAHNALGRWIDTPEFIAWKSAARQAYREEMLATAFRRPVRQAVRLRDDAGGAVRLAERMGEQLTVVAFISRHCAPSLRDLASLDATAKRLRARGIPVVAIVAEPLTPEVVETFRKRGWTGALHYDSEGDAIRGFRRPGSPAYFVVTKDNVARFLARRAEDLPLQVEALGG